MPSREDERIALLKQRFERDLPTDGDVRLGIGDDAAVLAADPRASVLSVDVAVEGVHFRRDLCSLEVAGFRAFVAAVSDLAAMGATPRAALVAMVLPKGFSDDDLAMVGDGIATAAREARCPVIGGNLSSGGELSITTTVVGALKGPALRRSGAKPGDGIYVTGHPGARALGLALLLAGASDDDPAYATFVEAWRRPHAELLVGERLTQLATAAVDLSDGLLGDLTHVCAASGVGAEVYLEELPRIPGMEAAAARAQVDATEMALTGGEGYELLFTAPASDSARDLGTRIGQIVEGDTVRVLDAAGADVAVRTPSFTHF